MATQQQFSNLKHSIEALELSRAVGRVVSIQAGLVQVAGLTAVAGIGDRVAIYPARAACVEGEVVQISGGQIMILPDCDPLGVSLGDRVIQCAPIEIAPTMDWLGRVIDANGRPMDGHPLPKGPDTCALKADPPAAAQRRGFGNRLTSGVAAMDTLLPLVHGQRMGLFAGSGVGKSTLLATVARHVSCDVCVIALIGERGRELGHFIRDVLGPDGMAKSVVVAATSDRAALERRRCAWTAMAVAEYFRDAGKSVLLIADSITRFAEAHREIAVAAGEAPVLRGFPPSTTPLIAGLCERAGPGEGSSGDITAVFSVLVAGSDLDEPIADILRGVLDGHIVLNREIAERGRYPAIDVLQSISRSLPEAASEEENKVISTVRRLLSVYESNVLMIKAGLYTKGADAELDEAIDIWSKIDQFLTTTGDDSPEQTFDKLKLLLRRGGVSWI